MPDGKPNILVIWGDDIGISNLSCYSDGLMGYRTPNIDRIANEGMRFTDSYGEQSCTAGRAAFISGQSVYRTGMSKVGVPGVDIGWAAEDPTIAELLKPLGYATGQFGKNHFGDLNKYLPTVHGFDEFFGNLYHLNAEEEPEQFDYPHADQFPRLYEWPCRAGCSSARPPTRCPPNPTTRNSGRSASRRSRTPARWTPSGWRPSTTTSPTVTVDYIKRQHAAGNPFFVWCNFTHMHAFTHTKPESLGQAGLWQSELPRHDDRPRPERRHGARRARRTRHRRRHHRHLLHRQRPAPQLLAGRRHHAVPQREGHQLGGRLPGAGDDPLARQRSRRAPCPTTSSSTTTGCRPCWPPPASPTSATSSRTATRPEPTAKTEYKVHIDGFNLLPYLTGEVGRQPAARVLLLLRRRRPGRDALRELEDRVHGAALPGHAADLGRAVHPAAGAQAVQPAHRPVRIRRHHVEHLLRLVLAARLLRLLRDRDGDHSSWRRSRSSRPGTRRPASASTRPSRSCTRSWRRTRCSQSWDDGPAKSAIVDFVGRVTEAGPDFVAPQNRVAVFDNDGTLWCEKPMYIQLDFLLRRFEEQAEADPSLRDQQPYQAAYSGDLKWLGDAVTKHYQGDDTDLKPLDGSDTYVQQRDHRRGPRRARSRRSSPTPSTRP